MLVESTVQARVDCLFARLSATLRVQETDDTTSTLTCWNPVADEDGCWWMRMAADLGKRVLAEVEEAGLDEVSEVTYYTAPDSTIP